MLKELKISKIQPPSGGKNKCFIAPQMKNVIHPSKGCKMILGKNITPAMVETHSISDPHEEVKSTKRRIKVRTPASWPRASWYKDSKISADITSEHNKCKDDEHQEPQPNEGHRGVINFYIGDYHPTKASRDERKTPDGKRCKEGRRRRLEKSGSP